MSSAKQYNLQPALIFDETVSGDVETDPTEILNKDNITYQVVWDGTLAAIISVLISSDYNKNTGEGWWDPLPLNPVPTIATGQDSWTIDLNQLGSKWCKLQIAASGGSADVQVTITGKAI